MKIQIAKMGEQTIEGYKHVIVSENYINFMDISNNECSEILANDVLDSFSLAKIKDCIIFLVDKLRLGGKLTVGGKDIRLFCKAVLSDLVSEDEASLIIDELHSMTAMPKIVPIIESLGLKIVSTNMNGIHFEVTARRG
jgi:hypothetical protein